MTFIQPPERLPLLIRAGVWLTRRMTGKDLLIARLLAWYPKAALSSGVLEALVAHHESRLDERMLMMVRLAVSFTAICPFCMDMNAAGWEKLLTPDELAALQERKSLAEVTTFSPEERLAVEYARHISSTPLVFPGELREQLKRTFGERELVILATTAAQVNYWARLIQALGCPPAGFSAPMIDFDWPLNIAQPDLPSTRDSM